VFGTGVLVVLVSFRKSKSNKDNLYVQLNSQYVELVFYSEVRLNFAAQIQVKETTI